VMLLIMLVVSLSVVSRRRNIMKLFKTILLIWLIAAVSLVAKEKHHKPVLDKGEKRFKASKDFRLKDFNFTKKITYFDVVSYCLIPNDKETKLTPCEQSYDFVICRANPSSYKKLSKEQKRGLKFLKTAIAKKDYFWKAYNVPDISYTYTSLRFIDETSRVKAIETLKDLRDIIGKIDTPSEIYLWLNAKEKHYYAYSHKKVGKLHRIRFYKDDYTKCLDIEYFIYYDEKGNEVKRKKIISKPYLNPCPTGREIMP